jgi:hypothetical protein
LYYETLLFLFSSPRLIFLWYLATGRLNSKNVFAHSSTLLVLVSLSGKVMRGHWNMRSGVEAL